jgi:hypothetical protein
MRMAKECEKYDAEHCKRCAEACRNAANEYRKVVSLAGIA